MDKPNCTIDPSVSHRKGIALLITLSVLAVIIALTAVLLSYFDEARNDARRTEALIQGNLYYGDIQKLFDQFGKKRETLYTTLYDTPIPLSSPDGRFALMLTCRPLANGVNINWLGLVNSHTYNRHYTVAQELFDTLAQRYGIEDASRLLDMLLEEIGISEKFAQKEYSRLRQKTGIISLQQLHKIIDRYQLEVNDKRVARIPWEEYFVFSPDLKQIDGDYISANLLSILFDIDLALVRDSWIAGEESLKAFVTEYGASYDKALFASKFVEAAQCEVGYGSGDERFRFTFDDIQGEVKNFEFYGKH